MSHPLDQKVQTHEKQIHDLSIQLESLDRQVDDFLGKFNVSLEKINMFIEAKENFTDESWVQLSEQKKALEEKLQREIANIRNPTKTKKALASLHIKRHWIPVR